HQAVMRLVAVLVGGDGGAESASGFSGTAGGEQIGSLLQELFGIERIGHWFKDSERPAVGDRQERPRFLRLRNEA
ncbi:MAG: hypothetical protein WBV33_03690, partial [Terracidiphilus sp.]